MEEKAVDCVRNGSVHAWPVSFDAFVGEVLAGTRDNLFDTDISPGFCESARLVGQN